MKKLIAAAAAVITGAAAAIPVQRSMNAGELTEFAYSLLGKGDIPAFCDFNGDGRVDGFDLIIARQTMNAGVREYTETTTMATEDNVNYIGRVLDKNDTAWLVQSGSAVEFRVSARSASINIVCDGSEKNDEKYRPRYAVLVDDEIILDEVMSEGEKTIELFSGENKRSVCVKVIHLSEANNGTIGVVGINTDSNSETLVRPTAEKNLKIEFIGDSITCAYGVEGENQYESFKTSTENFMKSYAYLTAEKLGADYSAVCYSGYGIISGYTSTDEKNTDSLLPDNYIYYGAPEAYRTEWDFTKEKNDVVVINLGTNDASYITKDLEGRSDEFTAAYTDFLCTVSELNPDSYIICTLGTMGCTELCPYIEKAAADFTKKTGNTRIMVYESVTHDITADGVGSDWHPSEVTQQNSAYVLADKICQALGMESDKIGLNAANGAEYSTTAGDGAMMSDYFSEWDKSYHVTVVNGGKIPASIQTRISGLEMKEDGIYSLTFDFSADEGMEIPFVLMDSSNNIQFSDTLVGTGSQTSYTSELFTYSKDDNDAELVFYIGGKDSARVSLYKVKLIRVE